VSVRFVPAEMYRADQTRGLTSGCRRVVVQSGIDRLRVAGSRGAERRCARSSVSRSVERVNPEQPSSVRERTGEALHAAAVRVPERPLLRGRRRHVPRPARRAAVPGDHDGLLGPDVVGRMERWALALYTPACSPGLEARLVSLPVNLLLAPARLNRARATP
jgi:hypothetical protein